MNTIVNISVLNQLTGKILNNKNVSFHFNNSIRKNKVAKLTIQDHKQVTFNELMPLLRNHSLIYNGFLVKDSDLLDVANKKSFECAFYPALLVKTDNKIYQYSTYKPVMDFKYTFFFNTEHETKTILGKLGDKDFELFCELLEKKASQNYLINLAEGFIKSKVRRMKSIEEELKVVLDKHVGFPKIIKFLR